MNFIGQHSPIIDKAELGLGFKAVTDSAALAFVQFGVCVQAELIERTKVWY